MKKIICILILVLMFAGVARADAPDLSDWTYDQLIALHLYVGQEIMKRPEWKEVTIPAGDWIVGVDIPEGKYSIRPVTHGYIKIVDNKGSLFFNEAMDENETVGKLDLKTAYTVSLRSEFIFSPAIGLDF